MKTKIFRISKQSVSILLSILMVVSMMLVGMVSTNATSNSFSSGDTIYFDVSSLTGWANGADIVAIFYYQDNDNWCYESNNDAFSDGNINGKPSISNSTSVSSLGNNIYSVKVPTSGLGSVRFIRKSSGGTNMYNYTARMTADNKGSNNCVKLDGWDNNSSWSTYSSTPVSSNWYLGGYINKTDIGVGNSSYKFSSTSTANVYELEITFTSAHNNGQYITINNGTSIYGTNTSDETLNENATDTSDYQATGKWFVPIPANTKVKFTWNASTNTISWSKVSTPTTANYYVAGPSNLCGSDWDPDDSNNKMTTTDNVNYTKTYSNLSAGTYSFKVTDGTWDNAWPGSNYEFTLTSTSTVTITFNSSSKAITHSVSSTSSTYTVTVSAGSNGSAYITSYTNASGTVVSNSDTTFTTATVKSGTTVSMKAVPNTGYSVASWNGASSTSTTYTTSSITSNTTVSVAFSSTGGGGSTDDPGTARTDVELIVAWNYQNITEWNSTNTTRATIYSKDGTNYAYIDTTGRSQYEQCWFALVNKGGTFSNTYWQGDTRVNNDTVYSTNTDFIEAYAQEWSQTYYYGFFKIMDTATQSATIEVGLQSPKYVVTPVYDQALADAIKIYAKDGTIRDSYQKYAHMADTVFLNTDVLLSGPEDDTQRQEAKAAKGTTITVQTTIEAGYRDTYYVKAFCVNGESYSIISSSQADTTNGVYTLTYTIPADFEEEKLEITPIYFYIDATDTITFYVEGFDSAVKEEWGDTISCHAYYTNGNETASYDSSSKNALGGYPGQPMVYEGGKYYMQIPKYLNGETSNPFKGITLNNYVWDNVHAGRAGGTGNNCQTYDYNDLYCIANLKPADNIIFSFKYKTTTDNNPDTTPTDTNKTSVFKNGWENLTDYYGRDVDLFGNVLSESQISGNTRLRIISNGYIDSFIGDYATEWTVYAYENSSWTKIATLPSSCLLYNSTSDMPSSVDSSYVSAYTALEAYTGYPAEITYEKSITGGTDVGNRSDGRWYYSKIGDSITVNTRIEYAATADDTFVEDPFIDGTAQGTTTGTKAYFTNEGFEGLTTATGLVDNEQYFNFKAETDPSGNYMFIGWYLLKEGTYTPIHKDLECSAPKTSNETYVARFIEVPDGMLTVTHELYKNAPYVENMPTVHTGTGNCYVTVEILNSSDSVIYTYPETTNAVVIDQTYIQATSTNKLRITLRTEIDGISTFNAYYVNDLSVQGGYEDYSTTANVGATGETSRELNFPVSSLFYEDDETGIPVFYVNALNFYSDIIPVTKDYKITFNYSDRFGDDKFYVVKGTLSESYIDENIVGGEVVLTNDFIMSKAPYEDNFGKNITWDESTITTGTSDNVLTATVGSYDSEHTVVVNYRSNPDEVWENITLPFGSLVIENGSDPADENYVAIADLTYNNLKFSHWEIYTNNNLDNLVTKCYSREFNYIAYDNYYITPVYLDEPELSTVENISTTLDFLEYSRNQWTDEDGNKTTSTDKLYADFNLAFNYNGLLLSTVDNVECGLALEVCDKLEQASDGTYISDLSKYTYDTNEATLKNAILNGTKYSYGGETRNVITHQIDNASLTNKNRIEVYRGFNNSTANPLYVIKCYSYMIIDGSSVVLSDPVYINLYDVANLTYTVS